MSNDQILDSAVSDMNLPRFEVPSELRKQTAADGSFCAVLLVNGAAVLFCHPKQFEQYRGEEIAWELVPEFEGSAT